MKRLCRRALRWGLPTTAALALVAWAGLEIAVRRASLPQPGPPPATPVLVDIHDRPFSRPGTEIVRDQRPVPLRDLGRWLPLATVGIEDHRFWQHHGVDWLATSGATLRNLRNLRVISGASTITQQTVKILGPRTHRTLAVKAREAVAALALERTWGKDRILETYLNRIDYGNRRFGAEAAAQAYFGKPAAALSLAESIFLAGIPQSPTRLNP
ncbi:MAG TPA: biosynthetic peptidoglycan transglycosylase, partial [Chthoniobacterales bacterium]